MKTDLRAADKSLEACANIADRLKNQNFFCRRNIFPIL